MSLKKHEYTDILLNTISEIEKEDGINIKLEFFQYGDYKPLNYFGVTLKIIRKTYYVDFIISVNHLTKTVSIQVERFFSSDTNETVFDTHVPELNDFFRKNKPIKDVLRQFYKVCNW